MLNATHLTNTRIKLALEMRMTTQESSSWSLERRNAKARWATRKGA